MGKANTAKSKSFLEKGRNFVVDCQDELKKVSRPTRQETMQITMITVVIMLFIAVILGLMDVVFGRIMQALLS